MDREQKERLLVDWLPLIRREAGNAARRSSYQPYADFLQDASLAVWVGLDHFDPTLGTMEKFLSACIRNQFRRGWKKFHEPKRFLNYQPGVVTEAVSDHRSNPFEEQAEFQEAIRPCFCHERELLIKHFYEGYSFAEMAEQQHLSTQRVQQKTAAAIARLRRWGVRGT